MSMNFGSNYHMHQTQRTKMAEQMVQSVHVLQFGNEQINEWLEAQLAHNPLLERCEPSEQKIWPLRENHRFQAEWMRDSDWVRSHGKTKAESRTRFTQQSDWLDRTLRGTTARFAEIIEQITTSNLLTNSEKKLACLLVEAMDDDGYIRFDLSESIAFQHVPSHFLESVLRKIQRLEPAGLGARNLKECVMIQLEVIGAPEPVIERVAKHFDRLDAHHGNALIREKCITPDQLAEMYHWIRKTNPKPGYLLTQEETASSYVIPDVMIDAYHPDEQRWTIRWNPKSLPAVFIAPEVNDWIKQGVASTHAILRDQRQQGLRVYQQLRMRAHTFQLVVMEALSRQESFLKDGPSALIPLEMQEIADHLQLHESTISRAVQGKWIQTSWGTMPLRAMFQSGIRQRNGRKRSANSIKSVLEHLLQDKPEARAWSDEQIAAHLFEMERISIARRTVNKYRQQLGIPCSYRRRSES